MPIAVSLSLCLSQDELMEELEKLQKNLDESFNDSDGEEAVVLCPEVLTTGSHSHPGKNSQESFFMIPAVCCAVYKFTQVARGFVLFFLPQSQHGRRKH